jgi:hypothetical protein
MQILVNKNSLILLRPLFDQSFEYVCGTRKPIITTQRSWGFLGKLAWGRAKKI